ncbi:MAG: hypothetical protein ACRDQ5_02025 [Sciscionella sp.]
MSIHMNVPGVHKAGDDLADMSTVASAKVGHSLDASEDAAKAHPGWASSGAVQGCRQAWIKHLTDLVGEVGSAARKLHDSASANQRADDEAAHRLNEVFDELSR